MVEVIHTIFSHIQHVWYLYLLVVAAIGVISWLTATYHKVANTYKKMSTCVDIVEQLKAEFKPNGGSSMRDAINRLEHQCHRLEFMHLAHIDIVDIPIFITNKFGKYTWANKAYLSLVGMELEEILGSGWELGIHEKDKIRFKEEWYTSCYENRPLSSSYTIVNQKTGQNKVVCIHSDTSLNTQDGYFGYIKEL